MKCPFCGHGEDKVVDSRESEDNNYIRRRRECLKCERRFTTYERIEEIALMVVKRDGRRQPFDRKKILAGLTKACEKRPVATETLEALTDMIERNLQKRFDKEVSSTQIGEEVIQQLQKLDEVAYVRFASVYRQFKDPSQFMEELKDLLNTKKSNKVGKIPKGNP